MTTVHIAIGNSDDKLSQAQWAAYIGTVDHVVMLFSDIVHGKWFSAPNSQYQNAAWTFVLKYGLDGMPAFRQRMSVVAEMFNQESIAMLVGVTEFITPPEPE